MSVRVRIVYLLVVFFCVGCLMPAVLAAQVSSPITISGTSTVRDWTCKGQPAIKVVPGNPAAPAPGFPGGVQTVTVTAPVKLVDCGDKTMHDHLRKALKEKDFPEIVYQLDQYTLTGEDKAKASGKITIAGVTKPMDLDVTLTPTDKGARGVGETSIDMTEFNVVPPTLFFGTMKVGKVVKVRFDALLQPAQ